VAESKANRGFLQLMAYKYDPFSAKEKGTTWGALSFKK
jgi:hypothetical protein